MGPRLVTATDGNHGRAVARMARELGSTATLFVPAVMPREHRRAHRRRGPVAVRAELSAV